MNHNDFDTEFDYVKQLRDHDTESLSDSAIELDGAEGVNTLRSDGCEPIVTQSPSDEVTQCPCGSKLAGECDEPSCWLERSRQGYPVLAAPRR